MKATIIKSKNIFFETVSLKDIHFIHFCRTQKKNKDFLNKPNSILDHIKFLNKELLDNSSEYFLIKENITAKNIGLVRISSIDYQKKIFTWGSWSIVDGVKNEYSVESAFVIYKYLFDYKNFSKCYFKVKKNNKSVNKFHSFYGAKVYNIDDNFIYYDYLNTDYKNIDKKFYKFIHDIDISYFDKDNFFIHELADVSLQAINDNCLFWQFSVVCQNSKLGSNVKINSNVFIDNNVSIGNNVVIKNNSLIYAGVNIGNNVFIGPNVVFTNDKYMDLFNDHKKNISFKPFSTFVGDNTSIGANVTILPGIKIGKNCLIGASCVVTKNIPDNTIIYSRVQNIQNIQK